MVFFELSLPRLFFSIGVFFSQTPVVVKITVAARQNSNDDSNSQSPHSVTATKLNQTRSLLLAGNFNITNNEDLFASLVHIGRRPREEA